jgi:hypothetical protein
MQAVVGHEEQHVLHLDELGGRAPGVLGLLQCSPRASTRPRAASICCAPSVSGRCRPPPTAKGTAAAVAAVQQA